MNRNKFITAVLAIASAPLTAFARLNEILQTKKAFVAKAGEGRKHGHIKLRGVNENILDVKISGTDTNGGLAIFEQTSLSQGRGTPLHVHPKQDEIFYVLEGNYRFKVGDELFNLSAKDSIFLPRTVPHAWTQLSESGKMMVVLQPAGKLESFFVTMAALDHDPTPDEIGKIFEANEMKVVGPSLKVE